MKILGFSEGYHDAGVTLIENGEILYASHAERYSKKKNDRLIHEKRETMKYRILENRANNRGTRKQSNMNIFWGH